MELELFFCYNRPIHYVISLGLSGSGAERVYSALGYLGGKFFLKVYILIPKLFAAAYAYSYAYGYDYYYDDDDYSYYCYCYVCSVC